MTVKDLKKKLEQFPDDSIVFVFARLDHYDEADKVETERFEYDSVWGAYGIPNEKEQGSDIVKGVLIE